MAGADMVVIVSITIHSTVVKHETAAILREKGRGKQEIGAVLRVTITTSRIVLNVIAVANHETKGRRGVVGTLWRREGCRVDTTLEMWIGLGSLGMMGEGGGTGRRRGDGIPMIEHQSEIIKGNSVNG